MYLYCTPRLDMSRNLQIANLRQDYRSGEHNLLTEFYIPCLRQSKSYFRAVGYFDSSALSAAARGLASFIRHGGEMRLIASPVFSDRDAEAIMNPQDTRGYLEEIIATALSRQLAEEYIASLLVRRRIECLAWLVSEGRLKIRIAYPLPEADPRRIYHEKLGIFQDDLGHTVAFSGSINESAGGWSGNFEAFDVFACWRSEDKSRVERKLEVFQTMWEDKAPGLKVIDFPEAAHRRLIQYRPARAPEHDPEEAVDTGPSQLTPVRRTLWQNQEEAIAAWTQNGFKGIFAMATGAGKTLAALEAMALAPARVASLVLLPTLPLLDQWKREIQSYDPDCELIACSGEEAGWALHLSRRIAVLIASPSQPERPVRRLYVIATMASASSDRFLLALQGLDGSLAQVVADEVHHLGAPKLRACLKLPAARRLGLSATPERQWDEPGTAAIVQYFGPTIYEYTIRDAITDGRLCHYEYRPSFAYLNEDEFAEYVELTQEIQTLLAVVASKDLQQPASPTSTKLQRLLEKRALIKKKAKDKVRVFREILNSDVKFPVLVFCEDNEQLGEIRGVLKDAKRKFLTYTSQHSEWQRQQTLEFFREGATEILLAIRCLDEGIDVPECSTSITVASSSSTREFVQRRGRILRGGLIGKVASLHDIVVLPIEPRLRQDVPVGEALIRQELVRVYHLAEAADNEWTVRRQVQRELAHFGLERLAFI